MSGYFLRNLLAVCCLALLGDSTLADSVKFAVSLNRRLDGNLGATLFVGNATSSSLDNVSLFLDIKAVLDESHNLVDVHGFVRDANANRKLDLSTNKEKEEEIKYLLNLLKSFCPKEGEHKLNIVPNPMSLTWREERFERRKQQADLLIVDGHVLIYRGENYSELVPEVAIQDHSYKWNFFIADDGSVLEALGFDYFLDDFTDFNDYYFGGLDSRSLIIGFVKSERDAAPSEKAMNSFHQLVKLAICSRKLIPLYKLIPFYFIFDYYEISNKSFERNQLTHWDRYQNDLEFLSPYQKEEKFDLRIVPHSDWSEDVNEDAIDYSGPAEIVVIMQVNGPRCFFNCSGLVRFNIRYYSITGINYLITEDGYVYECIGWDKTDWDWAKENKAVFIGVLGEFHSYGPNTIVFSALKALIQEGLSKGYLSSNYKIVSYKEYFPDSWKVSAEYLENQIKNLDLSKIK